MKRLGWIATLTALVLAVMTCMPTNLHAQQPAGTNYANFSGAFAAPALSGIGTSVLTYTGGTVYQGGLAVTITASTSSVDSSESNCAAPGYSSCDIFYWTSGSSLSKTTSLSTAYNGGANIIVAFVTTSAGGNILTITPASLVSSGIIPFSGVICPTGKLIFFADTGQPTVGTQGTSTTGVANQLWYTQIDIPCNFTITNLSVLSGGTATTDKIALGLWSTSGTLLASTAATVSGGTVLSGANTFQTIALTAPYAATAGKYIIGVVTSGTTAGDIQTAPLLGPVEALQAGQGTLATFTPVTTSTTNLGPFMFVN